MTNKPNSLLITNLLERGARLAPDEEIITVGKFGTHIETYAQTHNRASQLAHALSKLEISQGDRVGSLMWNNHRHLEAFYGVPAMGAVLHTLNGRLAPREIEYMINHAQDKVLLVDEEFLPIIETMLPQIPCVEHILVGSMSGKWTSKLTIASDWEETIRDYPTHYNGPDMDENSPLGLCYTSGTTGNPKGVVYTHRSTYLHTMAQAMTDAMGLSAIDCLIQVVPMAHVLGWGYPYTAGMLGAKQVLFHGSMDTGLLLDAMAEHEVTFSAGVPSIWHTVKEELQKHPNKWNLSKLERINCGASAPAKSLIRWYWDNLDVEMIQTWGMTETNPVCVTSRRIAKRKGLTLTLDQQIDNMSKAGLPLPGIEFKLLDDEGNQLPHDGEIVGNLFVKGPWICSEYFQSDDTKPFQGEWLSTGDVARIDQDQYLIISDRQKDLIKSGGEWISSIDLESHIVALPGITHAAVIAQPHPKWDERPVALIELTADATLNKDEIIAHCATKFAKWQLPDDVIFVEKMPLNSTGKLDKKTIRANLSDAGYQLPGL